LNHQQITTKRNDLIEVTGLEHRLNGYRSKASVSLTVKFPCVRPNDLYLKIIGRRYRDFVKTGTLHFYFKSGSLLLFTN